MDFDMNNMPMIGIMRQIMHMCMHQGCELLEQYDLKIGQAGILFIIEYHGEMSQRELASKMNVTAPSITAAIQKMEKLNFIRRKPDSKDQRIMRLSLTEKGRSCLERTKEVAKQMDDILFRNISREEKLLFRRLLIQMRENLSEAKEPSNLKKDR